jgi:aryl-alcohol dehydrogenase-like predicted oxidoreductase
MTRAGVTLDGRRLRETEQLAERFDVPAENRWGMSPFAGSTRHPVWTRTDLSTFFEREENGQDDRPTTIQACFRLAFELPATTRVAVGAHSVDHLRQLVEAVDLRVKPGQVARYRQLVDPPPIQ